MTEHPEKSFLPLSARDFHILFVLARGDSHGYGLVKTIEAQTDGLIRLDPANLYRAIQRMVDAGLVEDTESPADGGERRRYYQITELGRRVVSADAERMRSLARAAEAERLIGKSERAS